MSFGSDVRRREAPAALTFRWRGRLRTWRIGYVAGTAILAVLPLVSILFLGAVAYLAFHDELLASLISRQADIQYAYEDRIAVLRTELDRQTSRALVDHQTITTTIRDLASRSRQLEERAATIDTLVRDLGRPGAAPARDTAVSLSALSPFGSGALGPALVAPPVPSVDPGLRLDDPAKETSDTTAVEKHVELSAPDQTGVAAALSGVEARQARQIAGLRDPMMRSIARIETALAETGLPLRLWTTAALPGRGVGGPFEPLPDADRGSSFDIEIALLRDAADRRARLNKIVANVPLRRPLDGPLEITSPFGARLDPFYGRAAMHTGVDLMEAYGGPVRATAGGIVTVAGAEGGYGNMVEIDHGNGVRTRYAHLSSVMVAPGQRVAPGAIVGLCGSTGRATGPHVHYETRINGEPVDPSRFLRAGAALFAG